jgi:hypothetical protein
MKNYKIKFEDTLSFAITEKKVTLSDTQLISAKDKMKRKEIVINQFNHKTHIHLMMIIKSIELIED